MRKTLLCTAAAISLTVLTLAVPTVAQAKTASVAPAKSASVATAGSTIPVDWGTCSSTSLKNAGAECAKISVPLDWAKPSGTQIKIAISRVKHTVPASQYQGIMLVNPGGPGGSGLGLSVLGKYVPDRHGKDVGGAYDWIGFDPRGVGSSEPAVSCNPNYPGAGYNRPNYVPSTSAYNISDPWPSITNKYTTDCAANNTSGILRHMTTKDVAKDMNRIRQRLGRSQMNYYGFSYGTYLGQVYASMFPNQLRRVVFDGTVDPRGVWYGDNLDQDVAFDRNINIWFGWIAKHDDAYHLGTTKTAVRNLFYKTRDDLYANPVGPVNKKLGGAEWTDAFLYAGYYQSTWTDLADVFSSFINNDDVDALDGAFLDATGYGDDNGYAVYLGVQCTDVAWPTSWATWYKDNSAINAIAPYETWSNAWYNESCRHWPAPAHVPMRIKDLGVKSMLMIEETLDAATPYPGSLEVRKRFAKASLVAVTSGTTHANSLNGNACVDNTIADYLLTGVRPTRTSGNHADKYCKALPTPTPEVAAKQAAPQSQITKLLMKANTNMLRP